MQIADLDGYYRLRLQVNKPLPNGYQEVKRVDFALRSGVFGGVDAKMATFTGRIVLTGSDTCRVNAILDPTTGGPDRGFMQTDGSIQRKPVSRQLDLKVSASDGRVILEGKTALGEYAWKIRAERVAAFATDNS